MKAKAERFEQNYSNNFIADNKQHNDILTKKEFKEYYSDLLDSIKTNIDKKIKSKNIQNVTHIHNYYIDSSKTIYQSKELEKGIFDISHRDKCWGFDGYFSLADTSVTLTSKYYQSEKYIVDYWRRNNLFGLRILPKWGRKEYYRETLSDCNNDSTKVEKIIIKKRDE